MFAILSPYLTFPFTVYIAMWVLLTYIKIRSQYSHSLAWELPTNRLIQRLPVAKYLAFK